MITGEGFGHLSDIVGDVNEDTAVFDVELVDNSHDFGCHHFVIYLVQANPYKQRGLTKIQMIGIGKNSIKSMDINS